MPEDASHERPLTPEEKAVGSDDPVSQSEAIMEDSDRRTADRDASPGTFLEHRTSAEATPPEGSGNEAEREAAKPVEDHPEAQTDG